MKTRFICSNCGVKSKYLGKKCYKCGYKSTVIANGGNGRNKPMNQDTDKIIKGHPCLCDICLEARGKELARALAQAKQEGRYWGIKNACDIIDACYSPQSGAYNEDVLKTVKEGK